MEDIVKCVLSKLTADVRPLFKAYQEFRDLRYDSVADLETVEKRWRALEKAFSEMFLRPITTAEVLEVLGYEWSWTTEIVEYESGEELESESREQEDEVHIRLRDTFGRCYWQTAMFSDESPVFPRHKLTVCRWRSRSFEAFLERVPAGSKRVGAPNKGSAKKPRV